MTPDSKVPRREHDNLPTVATADNLINLVKAYLETPIGRDYPLPTKGKLVDVRTANISKPDGQVLLVRVHEIRGELKPGQTVILHKLGVLPEDHF